MHAPIEPLEVLHRLAEERPIFHSEADFQHALAWKLHQLEPNSRVRLEVPFRKDLFSEYLDLQLVGQNRSLAIELKYKTRRITHSIADETFELKQQNAQDTGRYDFLADICRLERFVADQKATTGYAIFITNDPSYWTPAIRQRTVDEQFRLAEGRVLQGKLDWHPDASPGTVRSREPSIILRGEYIVRWKRYSVISTVPGGEFRYLAFEVKQ